MDACESEGTTERFCTIACCTVEKVPDFTAAKDAVVLAVISKVVTPSKPQHAADLYIETMEAVKSDAQDQTIAAFKQLQRLSNVTRESVPLSKEAAWEQRKCRKLQRYPTQR